MSTTSNALRYIQLLVCVTLLLSSTAVLPCAIPVKSENSPAFIEFAQSAQSIAHIRLGIIEEATKERRWRFRHVEVIEWYKPVDEIEIEQITVIIPEAWNATCPSYLFANKLTSTEHIALIHLQLSTERPLIDDTYSADTFLTVQDSIVLGRITKSGGDQGRMPIATFKQLLVAEGIADPSILETQRVGNSIETDPQGSSSTSTTTRSNDQTEEVPSDASPEHAASGCGMVGKTEPANAGAFLFWVMIGLLFGLQRRRRVEFENDFRMATKTQVIPGRTSILLIYLMIIGNIWVSTSRGDCPPDNGIRRSFFEDFKFHKGTDIFLVQIISIDDKLVRAEIVECYVGTGTPGEVIKMGKGSPAIDLVRVPSDMTLGDQFIISTPRFKNADNIAYWSFPGCFSTSVRILRYTPETGNIDEVAYIDPTNTHEYHAATLTAFQHDLIEAGIANPALLETSAEDNVDADDLPRTDSTTDKTETSQATQPQEEHAASGCGIAGRTVPANSGVFLVFVVIGLLGVLQRRRKPKRSNKQ